EPLWAGIRALAAVDATGAVLTDESGEAIEEQPEIQESLREAMRSSGLVLDGFLTKQAVQDSSGVYLQIDAVPNIQSSVGHFFLGSRPNRAAEAAQAREDLRLASTFEPEDVVSYVAIDLLWLDGESLLDVPLLERRRLLDTVLAESDVVRLRTVVPPPVWGRG